MEKIGLNLRRGWIVSSLVLVVVCAGGLSGCGEIAFKRGSGPDAFAADRRRCQSENADPASVRACLTQAGWHVTDMQAGAVAAPAAPLPVTVPQSAPSGATAVVAEPAIAAPDGVAPPASAPPATPKTLSVGNWWRMGTGGADLHAAGAACLAKLGPSDAPDAGYHRVTPAFYACLRAAGWHGILRTEK